VAAVVEVGEATVVLQRNSRRGRGAPPESVAVPTAAAAAPGPTATTTTTVATLAWSGAGGAASPGLGRQERGSGGHPGDDLLLAGELGRRRPPAASRTSARARPAPADVLGDGSPSSAVEERAVVGVEGVTAR
jgi:hypothetical protein